MKTDKFKSIQILIVALFTFSISIQAQDAPDSFNFDSEKTVGFQKVERFDFANAPQVNVANVEELYAAVNNPANAGTQIVMSTGVYLLSATDSGGAARPNGGRLELQENMALRGVAGNRDAVVIDAAALPTSSYTAPIANTGAIRAGKGTNALEWLSVRNAASGGGGIIVHLSGPGTAYVRIAHIASYNNPRGIDVRNVGAATGTYAIELEIVDNDLYNNKRIGTGTGVRIINSGGGSGTNILASLSGNRSHNNIFGIFTENIASSNGANITVFSSGDRFFENGCGAVVGGALGASGNGNTTNFTATGTVIENNNGSAFFIDRGGLVAFGGENTANPNGMQNNRANVVLRNSRLANNQDGNLQIFGARSTPASVGNPGTNNRAKVKLFGTPVSYPLLADTIPANPGAMNSAIVTRAPATPTFDYDGDGRADISVFRPSDRYWYFNRSQSGFSTFQFGLSTDRLVPADFDGDEKTDIAVYRNGFWYWIDSSTNQFRSFQFGISDDVPKPADFDGDGKSEIVVWRPSNGVWYVYNPAANQLASFQLGTSADKPGVGDYDGDGKADCAVFRPSNGTWYIMRSDAGLTEIQFGIGTDKPVAADYDGDGRTDVAVFRPSEGNWYVWQSAFNNLQAVNWGLGTDALVPADYDGDGKADVAVYRGGIWYLKQSANGNNYASFGSGDDIPTNRVQ